MCCIVKCCNCHILLAMDMAGVACQGLVCVCVCVCARACVRERERLENLKHLSYCWMPDLENQEWWVRKLFDGMPTLPI